MTFTQVTVTHDFDMPDGAGALGVVEFVPAEPMHNGAKTVSGIRRAVLASGGALSQVLDATTDPGTSPPGVPYRVVVRLTGSKPSVYYVRVPHDQGSTLDLAALLAQGGGSIGGPGSGSGFSYSPVTLTAVSGVITPDATLGYGPHRYIAAADVALAPPTGGANGEPLEVQVKASGGSRVLTVAGSTVSIPSGTWWGGRFSYVFADDEWILDDDSGGSSASGSGGVSYNPVTLTAVSGVITPDATLGYGPHRYTATSSVTLATPTGGADGQPLEVQVTASGADRTLTLPGGRGTVTVAAGTTWWGRFSYRSADDTWLLDNSGASAALSSPAFTGTPTAPRFVTPPVTLGYTPVITPDASQSSVFWVSATGDLTLNDPANGVDGQGVLVAVTASGADRVLTVAGGTVAIPSGGTWLGTLLYAAATDEWLVDVAADGGGGGGGYSDAQVRAVLAADLVGGANVTVTPVGETFVIAAATGSTGMIPQSTIDAKGDTLAGAADNTVVRVPVGSIGQVLTADPAATAGVSWQPQQVGIPQSIVDVKGDLPVAGGPDTVVRLAAGTDGRVLTADSTTSTGLAWTVPATGPAALGNELAWTGTDYAPAELKADTSKPRTFKYGPDPQTISGVTWNSAADTWLPVAVGFDADLLANGEETIRRGDVPAGGFAALTAGQMRLSYFTATRSETITKLRVVSGPAATTGATGLRLGIYQIAADGSGTRVTQTASLHVGTTQILQAANTEYGPTLPPVLANSWAKVAGRRYAFAVCVLGGTPGNLAGQPAPGSMAAAYGRSPRMAGLVAVAAMPSGLPSSFVATSVTDTAERVWAEMLP